ncbi:MAG: dihydropteroate synthase [Treponema sp.]|nr:dihydropteroate synthase [Treponema sp.]
MVRKILKLSNKDVYTDRPSFIMGILNVTPDSFFEGSRGGADKALQMVEEGADIIDIGGESTRPGAEYVSEKEQIQRIIPVIHEIRKYSSVPISIDTRSKKVMEAAYNEGADILNDVSSLEDDESLGFFAADKNIPVILMHKRGIPLNMQDNTVYSDVFEEVSRYLSERALFAQQNGIASDKIIIDPGIGFGKNLKANSALISKCGQLCGGKYPVLMALSRKTCIGEMTGEPVDGRLYGTLAANLFAVLKGAFIVRVHDVKPCRNTLDVLKLLME